MSMFYTPVGSHDRRGRRSWKKSNEIYVAAVSFAAVLLLVIVVAVFLSATRETKKEGEDQAELAPLQVFNIVGRVTKIEKQTLVVAGALPDKASRRVAVTPATAITKLDFTPVISGGQKRFVPRETALDFDALKVGWMVEALASSDVSSAEEVTAVQIRVLP